MIKTKFVCGWILGNLADIALTNIQQMSTFCQKFISNSCKWIANFSLLVNQGYLGAGLSK